jgi:peptidyl-prolyl cis-trans isomerase B (cyclophilin B)
LPVVRRLLGTVILALTLAACGSSAGTGSGGQAAGTASSSSATSATSPPASTSTTSSIGTAPGAGCHQVSVPAPKGQGHLAAPHVQLNPAKTYTVTVATNCGTFAFTLDVKSSPRTSASFYYLVRQGFFDGLTFHRVVPGFVIQGGDPTGTGAGGPGYTVVEPPPASTQYLLGDVAMAKTQADPAGASGSQFFIVTTQNATQSAGLTPDYALVGKVVSGIGVVERIGGLPTNPPGDGEPQPSVVMSRVTVSVS